jgi:type III secretory pathway component EscV
MEIKNVEWIKGVNDEEYIHFLEQCLDLEHERYLGAIDRVHEVVEMLKESDRKFDEMIEEMKRILNKDKHTVYLWKKKKEKI